MKITLVAIDLAKSVFQIAALDEHGKVVFNRKVTRAKLCDQVRQLPTGTKIAMEACASAHYWGRTFSEMGYVVALIPPQHVKAFSRVHKSDGHDAVAILEAAGRPNLHTVPVKTIAQQDLSMLMQLRQGLIRGRTQCANRMRSFAAEYGLCFAKKIVPLLDGLSVAVLDEDCALSAVARRVLMEQLVQIKHLSERIESLMQQINDIAQLQPVFKRLQTIPGVGPVISATLMAAMGDGHQFARGRSVSAWLGLVPRQHGSGGQTKLLGISKNGNRELRTLLIHGARTVMQYSKKRDDKMSRWLSGLQNRRGKNRATVAYANKMARIAWSLIRHDKPFDINRAFR